MSKYAIATFIVCWMEGFICYLIGYKIGITHGKRTNTHECVKINADQHVQDVGSVGQTDGILFKGELKEGEYKLIKTTDGWVLANEDIVYCGWERSE